MEEEYLDLVDADDRVTGRLSREEIYRQRLHQYRVVHGFVVNGRGELWIPRRTAAKKLYPNGLDYSVAGHVASGEGYDDAFRRETAEELNINLDRVAWQRLGKLTPAQDRAHCFQMVYEIRSDATPAYNPEDFSGARWMAPAEAMAEIRRGASAKDDLAKTIERFYVDARASLSARAASQHIPDPETAHCWELVREGIRTDKIGIGNIDRIILELRDGRGHGVDELSLDIDETDPQRATVSLLDDVRGCPARRLIEELERLRASMPAATPQSRRTSRLADYWTAIDLKWKAFYGVLAFNAIYIPLSLLFGRGDLIPLLLGFIALAAFLLLIFTYLKALFHGIRHVAREVGRLFKK